jgi:hypothetical protein
MNYVEVIAALQTLGAIPLNNEDSNFQRIVPAMFEYAEGRIQRELAFLQMDATELAVLPALRAEIELPDNVLTVRSIGLCVSSPSDPPGPPGGNKRRIYPQRVSPEFLDMVWPQPNFKPGPPKYYTLRGFRYAPDSSPSPLPPVTQPRQPEYIPERFVLVARFAPAPERIYIAEIFGGIQAVHLSESNFETLISKYYSELLIAACMVYITGYQRDYGAASDDPQRAMSWEGQYQTLKASVAQEAGRLRAEGAGFTALPDANIAQQPRSP